MPEFKTFTPQVYTYDCMTVLEYPKRYELMYALARFQEYYENPVLRGKHFTRQDLQDLSPDYYVSWNGCNFPAGVVDAFHDPLWHAMLDRHEEGALLAMPRGQYIVGCHRESLGLASESLAERRRAVLRHEYAHAYFATNVGYRDAIRALPLRGVDEVIARLRAMGYDDTVLLDELQAYVFSGWDRLELPLHVEMPLEIMVMQNHIAEMQAVQRPDWSPWVQRGEKAPSIGEG